ncbi:DUF547 domain-containing protein [Stigmatella aurantiaca]|uniref:Conserved uncharacterized protein n=1 Tax=Stigmatella aurantiaca (strain DW4/3-1) TaxID=378806 RepID=E3G0Q8_STIAD|nr:DUF547 domain-containing protein [Stigmatella aurantiaca]ADO75006.1 conserved uncharacterized protein [Stigmatella aurantiaca DW4/3-1]
MAALALHRHRRWLLFVLFFLVPVLSATGGLYVYGLLPAPVPRPEAPFGYAGYARALRHVKPDGDVDISALGRQRAELDAFVRSLASFSPHSHPELFAEAEEALAYWLNAHTALLLQAVVDGYPALESVKGPCAGSFFWSRSWPVGGQRLTLWALEHRILLREFADPRIHLALFRGTRGGPALEGVPFEPDFLDAQLNDATRRFMGDKRHVRLEGTTVHLAQVFKTRQEDFLAALPAGRSGNVLQFVWAFLPDTCTERYGCDTRSDLDRACGPALDRCQVAYLPEDETLPDAAVPPPR